MLITVAINISLKLTSIFPFGDDFFLPNAFSLSFVEVSWPRFWIFQFLLEGCQCLIKYELCCEFFGKLCRSRLGGFRFWFGEFIYRFGDSFYLHLKVSNFCCQTIYFKNFQEQFLLHFTLSALLLEHLKWLGPQYSI